MPADKTLMKTRNSDDVADVLSDAKGRLEKVKKKTGGDEEGRNPICPYPAVEWQGRAFGAGCNSDVFIFHSPEPTFPTSAL